MTLKEKLPIRFVQFGLLPFASYMSLGLVGLQLEMAGIENIQKTF
jgi:hypothetical protein